MKNILTITFCILQTFLSIAQSEKKLELELKSNDCDNIRIRSMNNGDFLIFTTKFNNYGTNDGFCAVFNEEGEKKTEYNNKNLSVFIDKYNEDNKMRASNGSTAFKQVNENSIYSPTDGKMYLFINASNSIKVEETSFTGEQLEFKYDNDTLLKSALLTSWDMKIINGNVIRSLFVYNHLDVSKITLVTLDYNINDHSFTIKSIDYEQGLLGFSGNERPRIHMISEFSENRMLCGVFVTGKAKLCLFNSDLSIDYSDDIIIPINSEFSHVQAYLLDNLESKNSNLVFQFTDLERMGSGEYSYYVKNKNAQISSISIDENSVIPFEILSTIKLPFVGSGRSSEDYEYQLQLQSLDNNTLLLQHGQKTVIYNLNIDNSEIVSTTVSHFRRNLGTDITPISFVAEKKNIFEIEKVYGYCYLNDGITEKAILPKYIDKKTISFSMYTW